LGKKGQQKGHLFSAKKRSPLSPFAAIERRNLGPRKAPNGQKSGFADNGAERLHYIKALGLIGVDWRDVVFGPDHKRQ
jgi:hypothetical protein